MTPHNSQGSFLAAFASAAELSAKNPTHDPQQRTRPRKAHCFGVHQVSAEHLGLSLRGMVHAGLCRPRGGVVVKLDAVLLPVVDAALRVRALVCPPEMRHSRQRRCDTSGVMTRWGRSNNPTANRGRKVTQRTATSQDSRRSRESGSVQDVFSYRQSLKAYPLSAGADLRSLMVSAVSSGCKGAVHVR